MPQKKGVGGIGEAIISAAPWPCARRVRRAKPPLVLFHDLRTLAPYVAPPLRRPYLILPHSASSFSVFRRLFFYLIFNLVFVKFSVTFEAPNRLKCPQAVIQNRPSQSMCPNFGLGTFFVNF